MEALDGRSGNSRSLLTWLLVFLGCFNTLRASAETRDRVDFVSFDIVSQPLATALDSYGDATGREALFDTKLANGRISGPVSGQSTPDEALRKLLTGTGLYARFVTRTAFILQAYFKPLFGTGVPEVIPL